MLSAYVEVLLCVIELLAFVAFKNTTNILKQEKFWIFSYFQKGLNLRHFANFKKIVLN